MYVFKISAFWILFFLYPISAQENAPFAESNRNSNPSVLFIGNSFTYGACSAVQFYRTDFVTDLNRNGWGGVPSLFKAFTIQAGVNYEVYHEVIPGSNLDRHLREKAELLSKPWDKVVMHGFSTLDRKNPGNPSLLIRMAGELSQLLYKQNKSVEIYVEATWSRADQTYLNSGHWYGESIYQMAKDVRLGYDQAAVASPLIKGVIPVGESWNRAIQTGIADANPYDGVGFNQISLWAHDHYHGSTYGYYLAALIIFGELTGLDPRSLGKGERSAFELGVSQSQAAALQQVAFDELSSSNSTYKGTGFKALSLKRSGAP